MCGFIDYSLSQLHNRLPDIPRVAKSMQCRKVHAAVDVEISVIEAEAPKRSHLRVPVLCTLM